MNYFSLRAALIVALSLLSGISNAAPAPTLDKDPVGFFRYVEAAQTPQAKAMRQEIADGPAALAHERAAAQKEGIPVFPAQLNRPLPPDDQNAAPLYLKAAALRKERVRLPNYAETLSARYSYTPEQLARVQKIFDDNPDVFALLRQATDKPQCVFAHDWTKDALNPSFGQFAGLRETARELKTESVLQAEEGHYEDAVVTGSRVYRVAQHTAAEPTLIAYLTAYAINDIATQGMQDILTLAGPNAEVDAQVRQTVTNKPARLSLRYALSSEAALDDASFALLRRGGPAALGSIMNNTGAAPSPAASAFTPSQRQTYANLLDAAEADYIHKLRAVIRMADTPSQAAVIAQAGRETDEETEDPVKAIANNYLGFESGTEPDTLSNMLHVLPLRSTAYREITRAAAAVLAERAKTGAYPLAPPGAFPDPYTGKPLGYRREGDSGFIVYSAGPDGKYDGGQPGDKATSRALRFRYPTVTLPVTKDRE